MTSGIIPTLVALLAFQWSTTGVRRIATISSIGKALRRHDNAITWWVEPSEGGGTRIRYGTGNLGRNGTECDADFTIYRVSSMTVMLLEGKA